MNNLEKKIKEEREKAWSEADVIIEKFAKEKSVSKYGNKKINVNGVTYDSQKEYYRHLELNILEKYGIISDVKFHDKNDVIFICENPTVRYIPDFTYIDNDGCKIMEDVKGMQTDVFIVKKKIVISRIRAGEYDFKFVLTRKYKDGFQAFEKYSKNETYIKPKRKK